MFNALSKKENHYLAVKINICSVKYYMLDINYLTICCILKPNNQSITYLNWGNHLKQLFDLDAVKSVLC